MNDGAGYALLRMAPATRTFVVENDVDFGKQVVAHNTQCQADPLCRK